MLLVITWAAAILGDQMNFMIWATLWSKIIASERSKHLPDGYSEKAPEVFGQAWSSCNFLRRFFPIRTFVPFIAGMGGMHWRNFFGIYKYLVSLYPVHDVCTSAIFGGIL